MDNVKDVDELEFIKENGLKGVGKADYMRFLKGKKLTMAGSIRAMCYQCNGLDEKVSCGVEGCPLYPYHEYNPNKVHFTARPRRKIHPPILTGTV